MAESSQSGGFGGIENARDVRMLERAVRQGWAIPQDIFDLLPEAMKAIALNKRKSDRARIAAARVLTTMHGQNQDKEPKQVQVTGSMNHEHRVELTAAEQLAKLDADIAEEFADGSRMPSLNGHSKPIHPGPDQNGSVS